MNLLTPEEIFQGVRRKSVCTGAILIAKNRSNGNSGGNSVSDSKKKDRRRGSLSEPPCRRASLVQR